LGKNTGLINKSGEEIWVYDQIEVRDITKLLLVYQGGSCSRKKCVMSKTNQKFALLTTTRARRLAKTDDPGPVRFPGLEYQVDLLLVRDIGA